MNGWKTSFLLGRPIFGGYGAMLTLVLPTIIYIYILHTSYISILCVYIDIYVHSNYDIFGIQHCFALELSRATTSHLTCWKNHIVRALPVGYLSWCSDPDMLSLFCSNKVRMLCRTARPSPLMHSKLFGHKIAGTMTVNRTEHNFVLHDASLDRRWVPLRKKIYEHLVPPVMEHDA